MAEVDAKFVAKLERLAIEFKEVETWLLNFEKNTARALNLRVKIEEKRARAVEAIDWYLTLFLNEADVASAEDKERKKNDFEKALKKLTSCLYRERQLMEIVKTAIEKYVLVLEKIYSLLSEIGVKREIRKMYSKLLNLMVYVQKRFNGIEARLELEAAFIEKPSEASFLSYKNLYYKESDLNKKLRDKLVFTSEFHKFATKIGAQGAAVIGNVAVYATIWGISSEFLSDPTSPLFAGVIASLVIITGLADTFGHGLSTAQKLIIGLESPAVRRMGLQA